MSDTLVMLFILANSYSLNHVNLVLGMEIIMAMNTILRTRTRKEQESIRQRPLNSRPLYAHATQAILNVM